MLVFENPVLQRELLVNLRMKRGFVLLFFYQAVLGAVVYFTWPQETRLDLTDQPKDARTLVDMFFLGQYVLASMMAPSFAAGSITGEKERKTYEMLLASPLRPSAIVLGKMVASLTHLGVLVFASLPIAMLCIPLGGVSLYEVLAAYLGLLVSVITFGAISIACSSFFKRTSASLVVSYLLILPLAISGVLLWISLSDWGEFRLLLTITVLPITGLALCVTLLVNTSSRLLHPPDVGSEGKDVVDLDREADEAVGLVIQRDQFPDSLVAPPKRDDLMADGVNPVYDKEIRSELFAQGTLMLRLVIQVSMLLALPLMALCLYIWPEYAAWYFSYVLLFNMLVGPVFTAAAITNERERQTLDLLLTTTITPWQFLWGKLVAGLRVSSVLTMFLLWTVLLVCCFVPAYWSRLHCVAAYLAIVACCCLTTSTLALFTSVLFRKTSTSLMTAYLVIILLFCLPLAVNFFATEFFPNDPATPVMEWTGITSPFAAAFAIPLNIDLSATDISQPDDLDPGNWPLFGFYVGFTLLFNTTLLTSMMRLFNYRWRVAR